MHSTLIASLCDGGREKKVKEANSNCHRTASIFKEAKPKGAIFIAQHFPFKDESNKENSNALRDFTFPSKGYSSNFCLLSSTLQLGQLQRSNQEGPEPGLIHIRKKSSELSS